MLADPDALKYNFVRFDPLKLPLDPDVTVCGVVPLIEPFAPAAYLPAANSDPAEQVESDEWENASSARLMRALEALDERSRVIVRRRWLGEEKATLHALADEYGVSAERIRQIEATALKKLKSALA